MKFGLLSYKTTMNMGDDIWCYAASRFLPRIDYFIDRERTAEFESADGEPVAILMAGWFMWEKYSWPPARCLIPKFISFHYWIGENSLASPAKEQFITGLGADYLNAYGPIGCRDQFTVDLMRRNGVEAYFSGCVTLTLPNMPKIEAEEEYACLVDLDDDIERQARKELEGTGFAVITRTHKVDYYHGNADVSWDDRFRAVEALLMDYQNAKLVVTSRLHCALPCLAMGVPVLLVSRKENDDRMTPYRSWLHRVSPDDFLSGNTAYDFASPPPNPTDYLEARENLIREITAFADGMKDDTRPLEDLAKTKYTPLELYAWQSGAMRGVLHEWRAGTRERAEKTAAYKAKKAGEIEKLKEKNAALSAKNTELREKNAALKEKNEKLRETNTELRKALGSINPIWIIKRFLGNLYRRLRKPT